MDGNWRIEQLSQLVARALGAADYDGQASGRVRDVPDVRTIRYYTTLGLVDRPHEMQGRTAYYGRRHVLQVVAIKRLQAQGMSLGEVQASLVGLGEKRLAKLADLPADFWEQASKLSVATAPSAKPVEAQAKPLGSRANFWQAPPPAGSPGSAATREAPAPAVVLPLSPNMRLLLEGIDPRALDAEFFERIAPALAALRDAVHDAQETTNTEKSDRRDAYPTRTQENEHDQDRS